MKTPTIVHSNPNDNECLYTNTPELVSALNKGWMVRESYQHFDAYRDKLGLIAILDSRIDAYDRGYIKIDRDVVPLKANSTKTKHKVKK